MATCSFIKESKQTVGAMGRVLRYVSQEKKTVDPDGREYLSGINCGAEVAQQSFMATKESLEPLATSQQLSEWLSQTNRLHQRFRLSLQETVSEMKEQQEQDGNRREEFIMQLSEQAKQFRGDGYELMRTFRKWAARTILSSVAAALVISILICRLLT